MGVIKGDTRSLDLAHVRIRFWGLGLEGRDLVA